MNPVILQKRSYRIFYFICYPLILSNNLTSRDQNNYDSLFNELTLTGIKFIVSDEL